jgi:TetR/AcrR family transcriptional regulator, copper-responsive repressor
MPHRNETRPRGRPRAFDEAAVRQAALDAFWTNGFSGVSLDDLAAATGVARPSLAAAFGSKRDLYLSAVEAFLQQFSAAAATLLTGAKPLAQELSAFFDGALQLYTLGKHGPRGCLAICTLPAEAANDAAIRQVLKAAIEATDAALAARFELARKKREITPSADATALGQMASSLLFSLALRARAGTSKRDLKALIQGGVALLARA